MAFHDNLSALAENLTLDEADADCLLGSLPDDIVSVICSFMDIFTLAAVCCTNPSLRRHAHNVMRDEIIDPLMKLHIKNHYLHYQYYDFFSRPIADAYTKEDLVKKPLDLNFHRIGDVGCTTLAKVCARGILANLTKLDLFGNWIGSVGCTAIADACANGAFANLSYLRLDDNKIGDAGCAALAGAFAKGGMPLLRLLELNQNQIGSVGCTALAACAWKGALGKLKELHLNCNRIGDVGYTALADTCANHDVLPSLSLIANNAEHALLMQVCKLRRIEYCTMEVVD